MNARTCYRLGLIGMKVYLDGELVPESFQYSRKHGWVSFYQLRNGAPYFDWEVGGAATETRYGSVRTEWPPLRDILRNLWGYWVLGLSARFSHAAR